MISSRDIQSAMNSGGAIVTKAMKPTKQRKTSDDGEKSNRNTHPCLQMVTFLAVAIVSEAMAATGATAHDLLLLLY